MKRNVSLLCAGALVAGLAQGAYAMDLSSSVYGKAHVDVGYNLQGYTGDVDKIIDGADVAGAKTHSLNHSISLGAGYNVYYKYNAKINPFVGAEATFKVPVFGQKFIDEWNYMKAHEWFIMNAKLGAKVVLDKDLAVSPYVTLGFNVVQMKDRELSVTKAGLSTGVGVEGLLSDKYSVAVEYRYTYNEMGPKTGNIEAETHNFMLKFGYHFL